jgi:hypothetical protein
VDPLPPLPPPVAASDLRPGYNRDADHLNLLSIFHFVLAATSIVGLAFLCLHYTVMSSVMDNPKIWESMKHQPNPPPFDPRDFFRAFRWFYIVMGAWGLASLVGNLLAGFCLRVRRERTFCLVVAGFNCVNFPLGTPLGIFTIIVLVRESVVRLFASSPA